MALGKTKETDEQSQENNNQENNNQENNNQENGNQEMEIPFDEVFDFEKFTKEMNEETCYENQEIFEKNHEQTIQQLRIQLTEAIYNQNGWKRQYELINAQNEFHKQEIREQNITVQELQQKNLMETAQLAEEFTQLSKEYQRNEEEQIKLNDLYQTEVFKQKEEIEQLEQKVKELKERNLNLYQESEYLTEKNKALEKENESLRIENKTLKAKRD